jgi:glycosyltransferase involved in cell wall biosynthesis
MGTNTSGNVAPSLMGTTADVPLLLHAFSTFNVGGAQVRFAAIANHFGRRFRHSLVAMDGQYACRERLDPGLLVDYPDPVIRKGHTLANVREFRGFLRSRQPDVLVTYNWGSIEWAMANWPRLARHIHIEDGFGADEAQGQFRRRIWTRRIVLVQSTVIVPSLTLERVAARDWELNPQNVRYIPNGIDCARFSAPHDPALAARWAGSGPVIGTVAALRREKNLERLLRAFRRASVHHGGRLVIVGDGPERSALQALAAEMGIASQVVFPGHVASPETLYRAFDVFALSSDTEQMPYSIIEAMAAGLPIAATDVGDIRHMVAAENLPFISRSSDELLADALDKLIGDPGSCRHIGAANQAKARQEFDQDRMFAAYGAVFRGANPLPINGDTSAAGRLL